MRLTVFRVCLILGSTLILSSCQKVPIKDIKDLLQPDKDNTYKGPEVRVGNGHAHTFATITHSGVPKEVGVMFTEEALAGLPATNAFYQLEFHHKALEATLLSMCF